MSESSPQLSKLIFGTMGYGEISAADRISTMQSAIDHGLTSIDTAPLYGFGEIEAIVGRAIRSRRAQVQILGKCGLRWDCDHGDVMFPATINGKTRLIRRDSRPQALQRDIEDSLRRLRIEAIDLMQVHEHDRHTTLADTFDCLLRLQAQGKIRALGVSNFSLATLEATHERLGDELFSTQNMFNLLDTASNAAVLDFACRRNLRFLCYSPLAQGALAGKLLNYKDPIEDWRKDTASFHPHNAIRVNDALMRTALPITKKYDITLSQLTLEATLAQPGVSHVIVGARSAEQIASNARALQRVVPDAELEEYAKALRNCGWDPLAGMSWRQRMRAHVRKLRRRAGFGR